MNPGRRELLEAWTVTTRTAPALVEDSRWTDLLTDIVTGQPLLRWVSEWEGEPVELPAQASVGFLGLLDEVVEDEAGVDLDHLDATDSESP